MSQTFPHCLTQSAPPLHSCGENLINCNKSKARGTNLIIHVWFWFVLNTCRSYKHLQICLWLTGRLGFVWFFACFEKCSEHKQSSVIFLTHESFLFSVISTFQDRKWWVLSCLLSWFLLRMTFSPQLALSLGQAALYERKISIAVSIDQIIALGHIAWLSTVEFLLNRQLAKCIVTHF